MNCNDCKHAVWKRTKAGRLHPSGDGSCGYKVEWTPPPLPATMYYYRREILIGGNINRHTTRFDHCHYYTKEQPAPAPTKETP